MDNGRIQFGIYNAIWKQVTQIHFICSCQIAISFLFFYRVYITLFLIYKPEVDSKYAYTSSFFRHSGSIGNAASNEKPFACPVPGCKKRYKNVNGIKYHSKNGHKKEGKYV